MEDWLTYSTEDFILFSPDTYFRLFELYYTAAWPAAVLAAVAAAVIVAALWRGTQQAIRISLWIAAALWIWVAVMFHLGHYATINWAAVYFAGAFAAQGIAMGIYAWRGKITARPVSFIGWAAFAVVLFSIILNPILDWAVGRTFAQAGWFGLAPDPTVMATLGLLALLQSPMRWALMVIPIIWCAVTGVVLSVLGSPTYAMPPIIALLAVWLSARTDLAMAKSRQLNS